MFTEALISAVQSIVSQASDVSRGNVVTCDASENSVRLTVHSINGGTVASLSACKGWPFHFQANDGVQKDPSWPLIMSVAEMLIEAHSNSEE